MNNRSVNGVAPYWFLAMTLIAVFALPAQGQITFVDPRFSATTFATELAGVLDIGFGPQATFGPDLFVASNIDNSIITVNSTGAANVWANGVSGPWGFDFSDGGTFGAYLYVACEDVPDGLARIDPVSRSVETGLVYVNEATGVALSPSEAFGDYVYVGQSLGDNYVNHVYRVSSGFGLTTFASTGTRAFNYDLAFSTGGLYGIYLYSSGVENHLSGHAANVVVRRFDSAGNAETFSNLPLGTDHPGFLSLCAGGIWTEDLYVSAGGSIYIVDPDGNCGLFASGFGTIGGLTFSPDGLTLYVAQYHESTGDIFAIIPEPATLSMLLLAGLALLRRPPARGPRGLGTAMERKH